MNRQKRITHHDWHLRSSGEAMVTKAASKVTQELLVLQDLRAVGAQSITKGNMAETNELHKFIDDHE